MRLAPLFVLALVACGTDVNTMSDDQHMSPDGGTTITADAGPIADAMPIPPDGIPTGLTPCEEAVYHSDLAWIQEQVFDVSCTTKCHGDSPPAAMMSLVPGASHDSLVDMPSTQFSGWIRVKPGNPGASMLLVQLGGEPGPELEGYMPWGMPRLCDEKIDAIRRWVAAGAPR